MSAIWKKLSQPLFLCCALFIFNFCYAIPLLLQPMNSEIDAYSRARVFPLLHSGVFTMHGGVWLPLHQTFMSLTQFFPGDEIITPRVVSALVGSGIVVLIFLLTQLFIKHTGVSFLTAVLLIFYPLFHEIATTPLSEGLFLLLFLGALYSLLKQRYGWFVLLFILSLMTRFEGWFVIPWIIVSIALLKKPATWLKATLIACCLIFPIFYSGMGQLRHGNKAEYIQEMASQAAINPVAGHTNLQLAITGWNEKLWQVFPVSFAVLTIVGLILFIAEQRKTRTTDQLNSFVFAVLPVFLLFMLPIQIFLQFRDWLPTRYLLIPTVLCFPLMGLALKFWLTRFTWQKFWQWLILGAAFLGLELYSLQQNTWSTITLFSAAEFAELQQTLTTQVKTLVAADPDLKIYVYNPETFDSDHPSVDTGFVEYFVLPHQPQVDFITQAEFAEVFARELNKKIVVTPVIQTIPSTITMKPLFMGTYYNFFISE